MKVKDLLNSIKEYRKKYPDIDDWEVYTEQPELFAPEDNISYSEWLKRAEKRPNVFFSDKEGQWVAVSELGNTFHFNSEKEARQFVNGWNAYIEHTRKKFIRSMKRIETLEKAGWRFKYNDGWVYRDTIDIGNHTSFAKDKIFTI